MSNPRLSREDFISYIRAFNTRDYAHQHSFYASNVVLILPDPAIPPLHGSDAITAHYSGVHSVAKETLVPMVVMNDRDHVAFLMEVYFQYTKDTDEGVHNQRVKEGDVFKVTVWALYEIDEAGKMGTIRCDLWEEKMYGQVDVQPLIEESRSRAQEDLR
ncbi:putative NTF2-like domain superfamily, SnoaL-like domain-containing protein [Septoria linicola]|nr:putative NTF2-like domain superfamily, SnoaL-like domain-containing protein [Septoria linicola]